MAGDVVSAAVVETSVAFLRRLEHLLTLAKRLALHRDRRMRAWCRCGVNGRRIAMRRSLERVARYPALVSRSERPSVAVRGMQWACTT